MIKDDIKAAQREVAENVVIARLERMGLVDKPRQSTPHGTLLEQIMDPCQPKNEREWAAKREIERLEEEIARRHGIGGELVIARAQRDEAVADAAVKTHLLLSIRDGLQTSWRAVIVLIDAAIAKGADHG